MGDHSFRDFVVDQLRDVHGLTCRPMFGGFGLYQHGIFFGIIAGDRLYFKTDERTRERFIERGMRPFQPNSKQTLKNYYEVPPEVVEDDEQLAVWARDAIEVG